MMMDQLKLELSSVGQTVKLDASGIELSTAGTLALAFSQLSLPTLVDAGGPINLKSGLSAAPGSVPVVTQTAWNATSTAIATAGSSLSSGPLAPVGAALTAIATAMAAGPLSTSLKG